MLPDPTKIEPATSRSPFGHASDSATEVGSLAKLIKGCVDCSIKFYIRNTVGWIMVISPFSEVSKTVFTLKFIRKQMGIRIRLFFLPRSCHILDVMSVSCQRNRAAIDIVLITWAQLFKANDVVS